MIRKESPLHDLLSISVRYELQADFLSRIRFAETSSIAYAGKTCSTKPSQSLFAFALDQKSPGHERGRARRQQQPTMVKRWIRSLIEQHPIEVRRCQDTFDATNRPLWCVCLQSGSRSQARRQKSILDTSNRPQREVLHTTLSERNQIDSVVSSAASVGRGTTQSPSYVQKSSCGISRDTEATAVATAGSAACRAAAPESQRSSPSAPYELTVTCSEATKHQRWVSRVLHVKRCKKRSK